MDLMELLEQGKKFHGHLGPYLALGLKMGSLVKEKLGSSPFKLRARVTLRLEKPISCLIDGIQVSAGCTMGKRNITASEGKGIKAEFNSEGSSMKIKVKDDVLRWLQSLKVTKENEEEVSKEIMLKNYKDLFEF